MARFQIVLKVKIPKLAKRLRAGVRGREGTEDGPRDVLGGAGGRTGPLLRCDADSFLAQAQERKALTPSWPAGRCGGGSMSGNRMHEWRRRELHARQLRRGRLR